MLEKTNSSFIIEIAIVLIIIISLTAGIVGASKLITLANLTKARSLTNSSPVTAIADLTLWLETTSKNSFNLAQPVDGATIDYWRDINNQLVLKKDVRQLSDAAQPIYVDRAINGLPALNFDGVDDSLIFPACQGSEVGSTKEVTIFLVFKPIDPVNNSSIIFWEGEAQKINIHSEWNNNLIFWDYGGTGLDSRIMANYPESLISKGGIITAIRRNNNSGSIALNNSIIATSISCTSNFTDNSFSNLTIGSTNNANYFKGYIGEIIIFSRALDNFEVNEINDYLARKWSIKLAAS